MLNTLKIAVLLAASLGFAAPAFALQTSLKQVDKNADSNTSYRLSIKLDQGETLNRLEKKSPADFITVYSFSGLIEGSTKSSTEWQFSSEEFGRTPNAERLSARVAG